MPETKPLIDAQNAQFREMFAKGQLSISGFSKVLLPSPEPLNYVTVPWCKHFIKSWGWSLLSASSEQASLPFNHPDMKMYREHYQDLLKDGVRPYMVLNFDQLGRCAFRWDGKMQWKERGSIGKRGRKRRAPRQLDKKRHAVRGARKSITVARFKGNQFWYLTLT